MMFSYHWGFYLTAMTFQILQSGLATTWVVVHWHKLTDSVKFQWEEEVKLACSAEETKITHKMRKMRPSSLLRAGGGIFPLLPKCRRYEALRLEEGEDKVYNLKRDNHVKLVWPITRLETAPPKQCCEVFSNWDPLDEMHWNAYLPPGQSLWRGFLSVRSMNFQYQEDILVPQSPRTTAHSFSCKLVCMKLPWGEYENIFKGHKFFFDMLKELGMQVVWYSPLFSWLESGTQEEGRKQTRWSMACMDNATLSFQFFNLSHIFERLSMM